MITQNRWYKSKRYLHFDRSLPEAKALELVSNARMVADHDFLPLIHYVKISRQYKKDRETGKLKATFKPRHIFYASHADGYIYSFYAETLLKNYNEFLNAHSLDDNVLAYRRIEKNGQKHSNIQMAAEAFAFVKATGGCNVLCLDIKSFFDNLCPTKLKEKWCQVLGTSHLPEDHYNIYWHIANFRFVNEEDCISAFDIRPRQQNLKGGSRANQICDRKSLEAIHKKRKQDNSTRFVRKKVELIIDGEPFKGIPQGSAISGLLSNIFMIDFDIAMRTYIEKVGGCYRRYSDDIFIAFPKNILFSEVEKFVSDMLGITSNGNLKLNPKKTERRIYEMGNKGKYFCVSADTKKLSRIQYLGFTYDGELIHIRNSSISKNRAKISDVIRKHKKGQGRINTRKVYKLQSPRIITQMDTEHKKGFAYYGLRAFRQIGSQAILKQLRKSDKFIKTKSHEERFKSRM